MRRTLQSPRIVQPIKDFAVGLHYPEKRRTFFFKDYTIGSTPKRMITIGRGSDCDILFDSRFVSNVHAVLERRGEAMWIADHESTNGVYVNDVRISEAVALTVGMRIIIGHEMLVAADAEGFFTIPAKTISDMCRKAVPLYGSNRLTGKRFGRSHTFISSQRVPREQRSKVLSKVRRREK